jgi:adenine-specific DNA glycosylase
LERPTVRRLHAIIEHQSKWLMGRRPEGGLFGGLWEFIGADATPNTELVPFLENAVREETGLDIRVREAVPAFEHQLSHRVFVVRGYICGLDGGELNEKGLKYEAFKWIRPHNLSKYGLSAITKRLVNTIVIARKTKPDNY